MHRDSDNVVQAALINKAHIAHIQFIVFGVQKQV